MSFADSAAEGRDGRPFMPSIWRTKEMGKMKEIATIDTAANRQWGTPEERAKWIPPERLAALAVFLVSDAAAEITGAAIPVYGGQ